MRQYPEHRHGEHERRDVRLVPVGWASQR